MSKLIAGGWRVAEIAAMERELISEPEQEYYIYRCRLCDAQSIHYPGAGLEHSVYCPVQVLRVQEGDYV